MQEFWATATVHHHLIHFKINNKKHIVNLEYFREMLQIWHTLPDQQFEEPPFKKAILIFLRDLGHSGEKKPSKILNPTRSKRLKAAAKVFKSGKKKLHAQGLEMLSEIALYEAEQIKLATKRSKIQFHSSHTSGLGADEGTGVSPGVPDVPTYDYDDERISWKSSDNEDDDDVDDQNNDGDDFVHPKLSTHDEKERQDGEDYDEGTQGGNDEKEKMDEEEEVNELYMDVNINLEGRDTEMTDTTQTNLQGTQVTEDTYVILTIVTPEAQQQSSYVSSGFISSMLNPTPYTGIDFILNLNTDSTSLLDVPVTTNVEIPPSSTTTLPSPPIPFIQPQQQTLVPPPLIVSNHQEEQVKEQVTKILQRIEKLVNEQLEAKILTSSSNEANTSHDVAANLAELKLKKILIEKLERNRSIHHSDQQKAFYKALIDAYESDKVILDTYGDTITIKRRQDDEDDDEDPSAGSNRRSKRRRAGKEPESISEPKENTSKSTSKSTEGSKSHQKSTRKSAQAEKPIHTTDDLKEPAP
nr:hypothetical protein [Tanacetum cinerariifolium]